MSNKEYLIHEEDYIKHINEKMMLYSFVQQLAHHIGKLKPTRANEPVMRMAKTYGNISEDLFNSWGIPKSYLVFEDKDDLAELMENELIAPEDAGYYPCDDECDRFPCTCGCCHENGCDEKDEPDFEMMGELTSFLHGIFGDGVTIHIIVE